MGSLFYFEHFPFTFFSLLFLSLIFSFSFFLSRATSLCHKPCRSPLARSRYPHIPSRLRQALAMDHNFSLWDHGGCLLPRSQADPCGWTFCFFTLWSLSPLSTWFTQSKQSSCDQEQISDASLSLLGLIACEFQIVLSVGEGGREMV